MKSTFFALAAMTAAGSASAQVGAYGQCGGQGWTGETTCASGYSCQKQNDWYSQCLQGTGAAAATTKVAAAKPTSTKASTLVKAASTKAASTKNAAVKPASTKASSTAQKATTAAAKPAATTAATVNKASSSSGGVQYAGVNVCQHHSRLSIQSINC